MKITLHRLRGDNILTYGSFDVSLDGSIVNQLVGKNGSGKSSIPTIIEEILYNNNSRGIKKAKLVNRRTKETSWWGEITFSISEDVYIVLKTVKTTAKVVLTKNGKDISGHTATQTYLILKEKLGGMDFSTFSKLVYQSMKSSLDFIEATDTGRKKFLTSFLGLEKYGKIEASLKVSFKELSANVDKTTEEIQKLSTWVSNNSDISLEDEDLDVPEIPDNSAKIAEGYDNISNIKADNAMSTAHNKAISDSRIRLGQFNKQKELVQMLRISEPETKMYFDAARLVELTKELTELKSHLVYTKKNYKIYKDESTNVNCKECGHELDTSESFRLLTQYKEEFIKTKTQYESVDIIKEEIFRDKILFDNYAQWTADLQKQEEKLEAFGDVSELDNNELVIKDTSQLLKEINKLTLATETARDKAETVRLNIAKAKKNNEFYRRSKEKLKESTDKVEKLTKELLELNKEKGYLAVLLKAFGTKGLVAYKIESSIKIFEELINKYLSVFTNGNFALVFKLEGIKLQVVIYDNGEETAMPSLSSGEQSKVNISTLLAIRNLMSSVSEISLNTLFLDEVVSVLDQEALDTLIEILLKEYDLNTFIVSHGYDHPLTKTLTVKREGLISTISS